MRVKGVCRYIDFGFLCADRDRSFSSEVHVQRKSLKVGIKLSRACQKRVCRDT